MEDEQGAVEQGLLSDNLPSKSVVENMGSDNQVQESYEEGDGAEIMVEVVGSDVYVDGISAEKDGPSESGNVEDSEGRVEERIEGSETDISSDAMDVANEGHGNKAKKSDLGLSDSRDKKNFAVTEEVDGSCSTFDNVKGDAVSALPSRGVDVVDDGVWNPGIEATDGSSSGVSMPNSEVSGPSPVVISEEKRTEDEGVSKGTADLETSEPVNNPAEAVFEEKDDTKEKKEVLSASDTSASRGNFSSEVSVATEEVLGPSAMVISDEKKTQDEGVSKDSSDLATPETLNRPAEGVPEEKTDLDEKKQAVPSSDNSASCGHFSSEMSVPTEEVPGRSAMVISEEKKTQDEGVSKDILDLATPETLDRPAEGVLEEKADLDEKKQAVPSSYNSASPGHFSSEVSVPTEEAGPSAMVISDENKTQDEGVSKDSSDLVTRPAEGVLEEKAALDEKKQAVPSSDNSASHDHFSSEVSVPTKEVPGPSAMVISDEKKTQDEGVSKDSSDLATPETLNRPAEGVLEEKADLDEKRQAVPSSDNSASGIPSQVSVATAEVLGPSPMVISEEKKTEDEEVSKDSPALATPETLKRPAEGVLEEKADLDEKRQAFPLSDDSASHAHFSSQVSRPTEVVTGPSPAVIIVEEKTEVDAVNMDSSDLVNPESLDLPAEDVLNEKADLAEAKEVLPTSENSASRDHFSSAVSLPTEDVTGPSPMVISEEKRTEDGTVHDDSADLATPEKEEKKELLPLSDNSASRDHISSAVSLPTEDVTGPSPMVISEEKRAEDETVHDDSADLATPEKEEKKELLPLSDNSASRDHISSLESGLSEEDMGPSPVVIVEEKKSEDEAVHKDGSDLVTPEPLNHPAEVLPDEKADIEEKEEVLPSSDCSASRDHIDADSVMSHGNTETAQGAVESPEVCLDPKCDGPQNFQVDGIDSGSQEDGSSAKDERATTHGDGIKDDNSIDEKEGIAAESKDSVVKSDVLVSDAQDQSQGFLKENDVKLESEDRIEGVSGAGPESIHDSLFVSETGEALGHDECLKNDGEAHENQVFSNDPRQLSDGGDTDVVDKDKCLNVEIQDDVEKNERNLMSLSCSSDKELVQVGSGTNSNQPVIATTLGAEIDGQDAVISQVEAVDGGESREKHEVIRGLDDPTENMHIAEEGVSTKVEAEAIQDDAEVSGSPQITEQEVSVQITGSSNNEVGKIETDISMPNEGASITAVSDTTQSCISPERTEMAELLVSSSNEVHKSREEDHEPRESNGFCSEEEGESDRADDGANEVDSELGSEGPSSETDKPKLSNEEKVKYGSSLRMEQSGYFTPPGEEGRFTHSDLVWGKVRSHPWWPGQIFDAADASEKALKYHKKDAYLVAYFGDQTFAWNDSSALKPFRSHFSQIEKQSNSESFHNAVDCALEEVERRVELGLACPCIPKDAYAMIKIQVVENTGIHEEASRRHGVDQSTQASHFEPNKLLEYITGLAPRASSGADRLDLVIARAQLSAFCRFKGYRCPTEFPLPGLLLENDADTEQVSDEMAPSKKRRHIPKDGSQSRKERNSMELVGDREYSPDDDDELAAEDVGKSVLLSSGKKRKALDTSAEGSEKRLSVHAAKVTTPAIQTPKPSFKIGECIRRVASQLTGSTSSIKGGNDVTDGSVIVSEQSEKQSVVASPESLSVNETLSQLELLAQDPKKRHHIQNNIRPFFMGFRSSIILNRRVRKKKSEQTKGGSGEEFEFDDVNDSYWTDRIVQNYSEEHALHDGENGDKNHLVPFDAEKPVKSGRKSHSRKRFSSGISPTAATDEEENAKRRKQESSPAELILNFAERNRVPSEINLNKMFRRFGPLMESETEVDHESGCAKVIFKRGSDAEVARNSAEKFNIFGPVLVNYQIGYSPVISVKILPVALPQPLEDAAMML